MLKHIVARYITIRNIFKVTIYDYKRRMPQSNLLHHKQSISNNTSYKVHIPVLGFFLRQLPRLLWIHIATVYLTVVSASVFLNVVAASVGLDVVSASVLFSEVDGDSSSVDTCSNSSLLVISSQASTTPSASNEERL